VNAQVAPPQDHKFDFPPEITIADATLTWQGADTDLNLALRGDKGLTQCRSASGFEGEKTKEFCKVYKVGARDAVEHWVARVNIASNLAGAQAPIPYELHVNLSVLPFTMLGPALSQAQRSPLLSFLDARVDEEHKTGEPSLKVDDQGTVYIAAPTGRMQSLWKTTDGKTFEWIDITKNTDPMDVPGQAWAQAGRGGGDAEVFVTPDGKELYFADLWGCMSVGNSLDQGKTWKVNPLSCDLPLTDRQWLWAQPGGHVWFAYNGANGATVLHSIDGGQTWLGHGYVMEDNCARGNVVVDKDGRIFLAGCNDQGPGVGVSEDGDMTFQWHGVAKRSGKALAGFCYVCGIFTVIDLDEAGNPYVVWSDPSQAPGDAMSIWMSTSQDHGKTWSEPVRVNTGDGNAVQPWIAAREPGHVAIAWYQTKAKGPPDKVDGEWYVHYAESTNALDAMPTFAENLAWEQPVQYGPICLNGSACQGARNLLDFLMVDIGKDGKGHLAFIDGSHGGSPANSFVMYAAQTSGLPAAAAPTQTPKPAPDSTG
jgi:hypothetical protein